MERRIVVMRHAKSSWKTNAQSDHDRPLNKRGRRDAPRIGAKLAELLWVPERVLSSTAERTRQTWGLMEDAFEPTPQVSFDRALYLAGPTAVRDAVEALPDAVATVMLLGHNYGWEEVVEWLCGDEVGLTTCNAALLSAEGETWEEALAAAPGWRLHKVLRPKELST
jgi:phosphohistidine phosphatase SixA